MMTRFTGSAPAWWARESKVSQLTQRVRSRQPQRRRNWNARGLSSAIASAQSAHEPPRTTMPPASVRPSSAAARMARSSVAGVGAGVRRDASGSDGVPPNHATPSRTGYSRRHTGQPSLPSTMRRPSIRVTPATSHVSSCALTHRSESTSSMNIGRPRRGMRRQSRSRSSTMDL